MTPLNRLCLLLGLAILLPRIVFAQNTNTVNVGVQFEFAQPAGARSQAVGGAFVAVADDASAAHDNPAGLITFTRPEISVEARYWKWKTTAHDRGHAFGAPSGLGADTIVGIVDRTFETGAKGLSFASLVYPFARFGLGVYRRQVLKYEMDKQTEGIFFSCRGGYRAVVDPAPPYCEPFAKADGIDRIYPERQSMRLDIAALGGSAGYRVSESLSVGAGAEYARLEMDALSQVFAARGSNRLAQADFTDPGNIELKSSQIGDDYAWAVNAGALWRPSSRLTFGAAFHQGAKFTFATTTVAGAGNPVGDGYVVAKDVPSTFKVPDHYAAGAAFRPTDKLLISLQYERVNFSQVLDDFQQVNLPAADPEGELLVSRLTADDANRVRGGVEYVLVFDREVVALRAGATYDPQHQLYFRADDYQTGYPDPRATLYFPKGHNDVQIASGIGVVLGRRLTVDAAWDFSDTRNTVVVSTVFRW